MNILYKGSARDEKTMDVNHDDGGFMWIPFFMFSKRNSLIGKMIRPFYLVNIGFLVYNIK